MSAINIDVTKNVYDVDLQQEVTTYDVTLEKGYYPLPSNIDLSNYYTKQEVIDNFKPISYNPNIDEVITNGNTTSQSVIFQNSFGGSNWENEASSLFNVFKKINPTTNEVEVTTYGQEGFNSTSSSGYTAINFAPKTKDATILFPNESGTVVLDYQLNDYYKKTETFSQTEINNLLATKQKKESAITITGNTTLSETHNGAVLNVTNTCNITIPTGLDANFQCVVFAKGSVIVTFVNGGVTVYAPSGLLLKTDKMASLISTSANNFNLTGELSTS